MSTVVPISNGFTSIQDMVDDLIRMYPDARAGIFVLIDRNGGVHTHYQCNAQEMAMAAVRLSYLAGKDDA